MWLVLSEIYDFSALWLADQMRARGLKPVEVVTSPVLACALRWEHRIEGGVASVDVTLADGRRIRSGELEGVMNRLAWVPTTHLTRAVERDRTYAAEELTAFFMSWIHGLPCRVVNRATSLGLGGSARHPSEWMALASRAGLPCEPYRQSSDEPAEEKMLFTPAPAAVSAWIVGSRVICADDTLPAALADGCRRLSSLAGGDLLGIEFVAGGDGLQVHSVSPMPDLAAGGDRVAAAVVELLAA